MKKIVLLVLATFVTLLFVGCGSSGSSSITGANDDLLSLIKGKTVDLFFDISISNSTAASLRGDIAEPFSLGSAIVTLYKFNNNARDTNVYYEFSSSELDSNDTSIRATLPLHADGKDLIDLLLAETYEIEVKVNDNPILKSLFSITTEQKIAAINNDDEITCSVNPDSTAKAMLFEKLKADDARVTFSEFLSDFEDEMIASLSSEIQGLLSQGINIYNGAEFTSSITQYLNQAVEAFQQPQYIISGTVSAPGLTGTGYTTIYMVQAEDTSTGERAQGDTPAMPLTASSRSYQLILPEGSYRIKVFTSPENTLIYESTTILTVPQGENQDLTHDISID